MIETRLLTYFLAIAREQSITRAAETLHVSQPTLSKQMMDLEDQLGSKLLIRGKKKVTLTEEGQFLRSRAQEMLALMESTETVFRNGEEVIGGDIHFGCGETPAMEFITEIFKDITNEYPHVHFHLFSGYANTITEYIDKGLLDVGLLLGPAVYEKYDYLDLKRSDVFGLLMRSDHPLAGKSSLALSDLSDIPLIFPSQTYGGHQQLSTVDFDPSALNIVGTYNLIFNAIFMVQQGIGSAFCIDHLVPVTKESGLVFRPFDPAVTIHNYLITKKFQTFSPAVRLLLNRVREKLEP
jgi:DNA-binding transcriptional LysR family regulator